MRYHNIRPPFNLSECGKPVTVRDPEKSFERSNNSAMQCEIHLQSIIHMPSFLLCFWTPFSLFKLLYTYSCFVLQNRIYNALIIGNI